MPTMGEGVNSRRHVLKLGAGAGLIVLGGAPAQAHPMPDTRIVVRRDATGVRLTILLPVDDLRLAFDGPRLAVPLVLTEQTKEELTSYFARHVRIRTPAGDPLPVSIRDYAVEQDADHDVGDYQRLRLIAFAPGAHDEELVLDYDAIIHQVANHRALVSDETGRFLGAIRYSLARKRSTPLVLAL